MTNEALLLFTMIVPLAGAVGIGLAGRWPNLRESITLGCGVTVMIAVFALFFRFRNGGTFTVELVEPLPGLPILFDIEPLGMLFAMVAGMLWLVTSVYAIGYMRSHNEQNQTRFYAMFAISIGSTLAIAFAGNMFTLFLGYEILTVSTYPLVAHAGTPVARQGARTYLAILLGTSIGLQLLAILITYAATGTLDFREGGILAGQVDPLWAGLLYALYVFGIGKAAVMPFHRWLPAAMVAPTPVSALLHAVAVVKAGVFTVLKVTIYIFGPTFLSESGVTDWLIWFAGATILVASLIAMTKDNLKARLAYSTVSQLSYIVLGAMLLNPAGLTGGALHIVMHAFAKITLFFGAGAILVAAHKTRVSELDGLGRAMPITFATFLLASLSIIGLPPLGGVWSKWYLAMGTIDAGHWVLLGILMVSSLLNIAYLVPIPVRAFFVKAPQTQPRAGMKEAPASCLIAMVITTLACLVLVFFPDPFLELASAAAGSG